jgi:hypothetical protein
MFAYFDLQIVDVATQVSNSILGFTINGVLVFEFRFQYKGVLNQTLGLGL